VNLRRVRAHGGQQLANDITSYRQMKSIAALRASVSRFNRLSGQDTSGSSAQTVHGLGMVRPFQATRGPAVWLHPRRLTEPGTQASTPTESIGLLVLSS
jgi:hypothetical protein